VESTGEKRDACKKATWLATKWTGTVTNAVGLGELGGVWSAKVGTEVTGDRDVGTVHIQ
jgi:hypothetical protein